jgi:hypothetical protein
MAQSTAAGDLRAAVQQLDGGAGVAFEGIVGPEDPKAYRQVRGDAGDKAPQRCNLLLVDFWDNQDAILLEFVFGMTADGFGIEQNRSG